MLGFLFGFLIGGRSNREHQRRTMIATERLADKLAPVPPMGPFMTLFVYGGTAVTMWYVYPFIHEFVHAAMSVH